RSRAQSVRFSSTAVSFSPVSVVRAGHSMSHRDNKSRFGTIDGLDRIVWFYSLYPLAVVGIAQLFWVLSFLLYGHPPHPYYAEDPHSGFVRSVPDVLALVLVGLVLGWEIFLPPTMGLLLIEIVQRLLHRRRGILLIAAGSPVLWLLAFVILWGSDWLAEVLLAVWRRIPV